ncbi:MAG: hypothetical protein M1360_04380 [Candidatus Marsarchaeota archaeon]|jgi:hypothetical protein|nr:hypothetical protein [Candidatus Marsarchaeota archaeon]MCL5419143.1 hypothetical protein [Candidatus Marsarchaeota archaeon]
MMQLKAQAAIMEALVSAMAITIFLSMSSSIAYTATRSSGALKYSNAAFDFIEMAYSNGSASQCIWSSNSTCITRLLERFSSIYGISYISISGTVDGNYGNKSNCNTNYRECFIDKQDYKTECINVCD